MKTLIIGYGNPDREDDGVAWHILTDLAERLGLPGPYDPQLGFEPEGGSIALWFMLQLSPEIAEIVAEYDRVCFVDAHTGAVPKDLNIEEVESRFQNSPFTHHMTPNTVLSFVETIYNKKPQGLLVSVRGYQFRFMQSLSEKTAILASQAADEIWDWIDKN